jgi:hypothetical protein
MRQQEKLAAVAAQDLLKANASRQRRAAAQSRKGAPATRKGSAGTAGKAAGKSAVAAPLTRKSAGGAAAPSDGGTGIPSALPEKNSGSGFVGAASPSSFTDGSCFFTGGPGNFFGNGSQSPLPQPWMLQGGSSDPATW